MLKSKIRYLPISEVMKRLDTLSERFACSQHDYINDPATHQRVVEANEDAALKWDCYLDMLREYNQGGIF